MLNVTSKSETETFLIRYMNFEFTETLAVMQRDIEGHQIALKQRNQNPQNNMITSFSFALTAHVTQWSNYLTQWAEILTRGSNLTPQREKNMTNVTQAKADLWLHSFLSFLPETTKLQSTGYSEWK